MATSSQLSKKKSDFQQLHPSLKSYQASIAWFRYTEICPLCKESLVIFNEDAYPCRVCGKAYHLDCMKRHKSMDAQAVKLMERAKTPLGWSCDQCSDINVLTPVEQTNLMEMFDRDDPNHDYKITLKEFLKADDGKSLFLTTNDPADVVSGKANLNLTEEQVIKYKTYLFNIIDSDNSGYLDFQEYCNCHMSMVLAQRNPEELLAVLTPVEMQRCKFIFEIIDTDSDGTITISECDHALKAWFDHMLLLRNAKKNHPERFEKNPIPDMICSDRQAKLVALNIKMMIGINRMRTVTFRDYLLEQAPAIIAQRPNKGIVNTDPDAFTISGHGYYATTGEKAVLPANPQSNEESTSWSLNAPTPVVMTASTLRPTASSSEADSQINKLNAPVPDFTTRSGHSLKVSTANQGTNLQTRISKDPSGIPKAPPNQGSSLRKNLSKENTDTSTKSKVLIDDSRTGIVDQHGTSDDYYLSRNESGPSVSGRKQPDTSTKSKVLINDSKPGTVDQHASGPSKVEDNLSPNERGPSASGRKQPKQVAGQSAPRSNKMLIKPDKEKKGEKSARK